MASKKCVLSLTFRHYGSSHFSISEWNDVKNSKTGILKFKPFGGLWASPIGKRFKTWEDFIKSDYQSWEGSREYFDFNLVPMSKVFVIRSQKDLDELTEAYGNRIKGSYVPHNPLLSFAFEIAFDYEAMKKDGYDAIYFEISAFPDLYELLYGLDVDSLLVLNPKSIREKNTTNLEALIY